MKKKYFILIFIGLIAMITVSFILQNLYSEKTRYFGFAAGMFFIAVFALFSYKNALKPTGFISEKKLLKSILSKARRTAEIQADMQKRTDTALGSRQPFPSPRSDSHTCDASESVNKNVKSPLARAF